MKEKVTNDVLEVVQNYVVCDSREHSTKWMSYHSNYKRDLQWASRIGILVEIKKNMFRKEKNSPLSNIYYSNWIDHPNLL